MGTSQKKSQNSHVHATSLSGIPPNEPDHPNSDAKDKSVPLKLFLDSKCLRQPKASAAIKDCLFYEGVNLLLASYSEGGGGATCELTPQLRWTGQHATWRITSPLLTSSKQTQYTSFSMYVTLPNSKVLSPLQLWLTKWLMETALKYEFQNRNSWYNRWDLHIEQIVRSGLHSSGMLRGVGWYLITNVSEHPACPLMMRPTGCPETSVMITNARYVTSR